MTPWWQVSWKRVGLALLAIFASAIVLCGVAFAVIYQLDPWLSARRMRAVDPELDVIPSALQDTSVVDLPGERVEYFGFSFQLPWKHTYRVIDAKRQVFLSSDEGADIRFDDPLSDPWTPKMIRGLARPSSDLNPGIYDSLCRLERVAMKTKPEEVTWWKLPSENRRARDLLFLKEITEPMYRGSIYTVDIGGLCGFQRGDPTVAPYQVRLELFDSADRHYRISIGSKAPFLTQAQVNAIVASIHPVSPH
jgi:hypothetical protein